MLSGQSSKYGILKDDLRQQQGMANS